jgi:RNA polymerase sigma factor (sigma-70 family)
LGGAAPRGGRRGRHERLSPEAERGLAVRAQAGDSSARDTLIEANVPLVMALAREYQGPRLELADLVQEGIIGLCAAVDRFDPGRGVRFGTYAALWIKQRLRRARYRCGSLIYLPEDVRDAARKAQRLRRRLAEQRGSEPDLAELAALCGVSSARLEALLLCASEPCSLDAGGDGVQPVGLESIPDPQAPDPAAMLTVAADREALAVLMAALPGRDRQVLEGRFGLRGEEVSTAVLARRLRISPEGVRQIQRRALLRLRKAWGQHPAHA